MYSGNLGLAHDYITFVYGYKKFINNNKNKFKLWTKWWVVSATRHLRPHEPHPGADALGAAAGAKDVCAV